MLHTYLWSARLGELCGDPFPDDILDRLARSAALLYQLLDERTGRVPCYGNNDGAHLFPLSNCDYQDYRPIVQAIHYLKFKRRCLPPGPWDEDLLWFFGPSARVAKMDPPRRHDLKAHEGGCFSLRTGRSMAFVRCGGFRHRPGQADLLHVDVWWRGCDIAVDPGTYSYNAPPPWNNVLGDTAFHNTVTIDGQNQMCRASRFAWVPWARGVAEVHQLSSNGRFAVWRGAHDGYKRIGLDASHRRTVWRIGDDHFVVLDAIAAAAPRRFRLHWLCADYPFQWDSDGGRLSLQTPSGDYSIAMGAFEGQPQRTFVRGEPNGPRGWRAPYYGAKEPALSVDLTQDGQSAMFWTVFGPPPTRIAAQRGKMEIETSEWLAQVHFARHGDNRARDALVDTYAVDLQDKR
jgi:hypothetical protein